MSILIQLNNVHKTYNMGLSTVHALRGVSLSISQGEFVGITGASGSGKSTMMGILGCLDKPTSGQYYFDGQPVSEFSERQLAKVRNESLGFVFQMFNLLPRVSALENVSIPLFYARKTRYYNASLKALEMVGLSNRATHKPAELSGGERQRIAIARAIVNNPKVILADEPTGNLDSHTGAQIMTIFHELNKRGVTIVLVTHEPDIAIQTKRIIKMRDGKVLEDSPVDEKERNEALEMCQRLAKEKIEED